MIENWKPIRGRKGYEVSDCGRVRSLDRVVLRPNRKGGDPIPHKVPGRILSPRPLKKSGYLRVVLSGRDFRIHRLVAKAFVPGWFPGACVNHKDFDKTNNKKENLEWVSHLENMGHLAASGRLKGLFSGEKNPNHRSKRR